MLATTLLVCRPTCAAPDNLLRYANLEADWLKEALLWNDEQDGKPKSPEAIEQGLQTLEKRLGLSSEFRANSEVHNFTWHGANKTFSVKLYTTKCGRLHCMS